MTLKNQHGKSLIEIILVLLIIGILSVAAIPQFFDTSEFSLDTAVQKIREDLRFAQSLAEITENQIAFQVTSATTYQIFNVSTATVVTSPYTKQDMIEDLSVDFGATVFQDTTYATTFDPSSLFNGITGDTSIQINNGGSSRTITINTTTGNVFVAP